MIALKPGSSASIKKKKTIGIVPRGGDPHPLIKTVQDIGSSIACESFSEKKVKDSISTSRKIMYGA